MVRKISMALALGFLAQCNPPQSPAPDITVIQISEAAYEDFEVPDIPPYSELWVKMNAHNFRPDMRYRCYNMGGTLVDDICRNVDY